MDNGSGGGGGGDDDDDDDDGDDDHDHNDDDEDALPAAHSLALVHLALLFVINILILGNVVGRRVV